jgi:hypothetical protein
MLQCGFRITAIHAGSSILNLFGGVLTASAKAFVVLHDSVGAGWCSMFGAKNRKRGTDFSAPLGFNKANYDRVRTASQPRD